ncbi:MAG: hypothetical protein COX79_02205 [Candidatus Levybacteria bacterium CG_4_10_14_0_2_um_filter_36_16]|nr:MAG: hypothetical protein COX79_02205 [Candidatus Levybacteria bacterium CG_4_10_14_0_2_um_filter_36_16]
MKAFTLILKRFHRFRYFKWVLRLFIVGIIVTAIWSIAGHKTKPLCKKCNVILVSLDTLSALHLPCYGYERNTAPNLCAYADKNIFFSNSYSQAPITLDSHFSIFTSLYPHTHKMVEILKEPLSEKYLTLPQIFRFNGYQTIYHGGLKDFHLPLNRGIERGFNIIEGDSIIDSWKSAYLKLSEKVGEQQPIFLFLHTYAVHNPYLTGHKLKHLFTDLPEYPNIPLTKEEHENIRSLEFFTTAEKYFFDANSPIKNSKEKDLDRQIMEKIKFAPTLEEKENLFKKLSWATQVFCMNNWDFNDRIDRNDPKQIEYLKALYDEQIHNLDNKLGELFKLMDDPKLSKNTILIITADHGEEFMEHGNIIHGSDIYRTQTQVPLIMHIPGVNLKKIKEMVQGIDIYPTVLNLTGLKPKSKIEGIDLTGIIKGDKNAVKNEYLLSEFKGMAGIQMQNWRFYYNTKKQTPTGLYDLNSDPVEQNNLLSQNPQKTGEFVNLVNKLNLPSQ